MKEYLVLDLSITNLDPFLEYAEQIPGFIEKHGGRYLVQGVIPEVMEGSWKPDRLVILEFPSEGKAKEFLSDPDAQELFALRKSSTNSKLILAKGCI